MYAFTTGHHEKPYGPTTRPVGRDDETGLTCIGLSLPTLNTIDP